MFQRFFTLITLNILQEFKKNKDFFLKKNESKDEILNKINVPKSVKQYLVKVDEQSFLKDLKNLSKPSQSNELISSIGEYLAVKFAQDLYSLPISFYKQTEQEQINTIQTIIPDKDPLNTELKKIIKNYSYQEIFTQIIRLTKTPIILIQSPLELDMTTKLDIRDKLQSKSQKIIVPTFQINKELIGGLRIFIDGTVTDLSWLKKINLITTLTH